MISEKTYLAENISDLFQSEVLNEQELASVRGGIRRKPKSRDKDVLDLEDGDDD